MKNLHYFLFLILIMCYCNRNSEVSSNKINNYKIIGDAFLEKQDEIYLLTKNGPFIGHISKILATKNSFIIIDYISQLVYEYDLNGNYIKTFSSSGKGPGEYIHPFYLTTDFSDNIIIKSADNNRLNVYNKAGEFLQDLNKYKRLGYFNNPVFDTDGNIIYFHYALDNVYLRKYKRIENTEVFSIPLLSGQLKYSRALVDFFIALYQPSLNKIYYLYPTEYKIHEIDANTGRLVKILGIKPQNYKFFDSKKYASNQQRREINDYIVHKVTLHRGGIHLFMDKYLLVGFASRADDYINWILYDIMSNDKAYEIKTKMKNSYYFSDNYYLYKLGIFEDLDKYNGIIEVYKLRIKLTENTKL